MSSTPPRFVPTLTDVVTPVTDAASLAPSDFSEARVAPDVVSAQAMFDLEARLVLGVMQRVDVMLERRVREAVGQVISEHSEGLVQRLREEIEQVVHEVVGQAVDGELNAVAGK